MAWIITDTTSTERSRGDLCTKGTLFHPLAVQIDALAFVAEVNTRSVTENASLQRDTATHARTARAEPLSVQVRAVDLGGFWDAL